MISHRFLVVASLAALGAAGEISAQSSASSLLPEVSVSAARVANDDPAGTFAMPVTALRFEPLVDVQARNLAEGQADVAIRGGVFEQTGFRVGALALYDPQTGHYFAEIPVAPGMLTAPTIETGFANALRGWNAGAGTVVYGWRPIQTQGVVSAGWGEFNTRKADVYQGARSSQAVAGRALAGDLAFGYSESDGAIAWGDHEFQRIAGRVQLAGQQGQTDLFAGYQHKRFGWPNLYTPFNSLESENLQTVLLAANHRENLGQGDFLEAGIYYRRNKDDYAFNRLAPLAAVHPFQHTTWTYGAGVESRRTLGEVAWTFAGTAVSDELKSTSLTAGRFHERKSIKLALAPEHTWKRVEGGQVTARVGLSYDDTNRDGSAVSPLGEIRWTREGESAGVQHLYLSFARATQTATYTALNSASGAGLFRGNANLGRAASENLEAGVRSRWDAWSLTAAVFNRWDDRLVDWTYRTGVTARTANPVDLTTAGVEGVLRYSSARWEVVAGYTYLHKDADYGLAAVDASFYALNFPEHRLTLAAIGRLGAGWEVRIDNELRRQQANALRVRGGDEAWLTAAALSYTPPAVRGLTLSLQVDNLWDDDFQEVPAVPATPRQVSGCVRYAW